MYAEGYYCADVCDPSPCEADETCTFVSVPCPAVVGAVCPPEAECFPSTTDPCDACGEFQVNEKSRGVEKSAITAMPNRRLICAAMFRYLFVRYARVRGADVSHPIVSSSEIAPVVRSLRPSDENSHCSREDKICAWRHDSSGDARSGASDKPPQCGCCASKRPGYCPPPSGTRGQK